MSIWHILISFFPLDPIPLWIAPPSFTLHTKAAFYLGRLSFFIQKIFLSISYLSGPVLDAEDADAAVNKKGLE